MIRALRIKDCKRRLKVEVGHHLFDKESYRSLKAREGDEILRTERVLLLVEHKAFLHIANVLTNGDICKVAGVEL